LGIAYDPLYLEGNSSAPLKFQAPALVLDAVTTPDRLAQRRGLLAAVENARREFDGAARPRAFSAQRERAFSLLSSSQTHRAFDLSQEPRRLRDRYGETVNGMSLLLARRLVEAGVPFITVFWRGDPDRLNKKCASGGGWDTHGNNFNCLKEDLLPEFDRAFSALVEDLADRGLLPTTLLLVTSEMGRQPKIGDPRSGGVSGAGRDHWTHCLTDLLAGGGVRGGQTFGSSDRYGEYPAQKPVTPADVAKTVFWAMGIHNLEAFDEQNRPYNLLEQGSAIADLF